MRTFQLLVLGFAALASASTIPLRSPQYISGRHGKQVQIQPLEPGTYPISPPDLPTLPVLEPIQPEVGLNLIAGHKVPAADSFLGVESISEPEVIVSPSIGKPGVYPIKPPQDPTLPVESLPGNVVVSPVAGVYPIITPIDPNPSLPVLPETQPGFVVVNPAAGHKVPESDSFLGVEPINEPEVIIIPALPGTYPIFPPAEPSLGVEPEQEHNVIINPIAGVYPIVIPQDPTLPVESQPGDVIVNPVISKPEAGVYPIKPPQDPTLPVESLPGSGHVVVNPVAGIYPIPPADQILPVVPETQPGDVVVTPHNPVTYPIILPASPTLRILPILH